MNTSEIGKYFKATRERRPVTLAGYINDSALVTDGNVLLLLTAAELVHAFARRDWWPSLPEGDEAYQYTIDSDDTKPKEERIIVSNDKTFGNKVLECWNEWTDIKRLEPITFTPWVQMMEEDLRVHLLRRGDEYLYLDTEKVALITDWPMTLRWYWLPGVGNERMIVAADGPNPIAVLAALDPNALEVLRPPDDDLAQAIKDYDREMKAAGMSVTLSDGEGRSATLGVERELANRDMEESNE